MAKTPKGAAAPQPAPEPLALPHTLLAPATVGVTYDGHIEPAEGGQAPYAYAVTGGDLPSGFVLGNEQDGPHMLGGEPASPGEHVFEITATDASGAKVSREYSLKVVEE